ncbi:MBL fold metallo-hydrolase [Streptomyces sp. MBT62]|uniref:MBL fold metallo-hydrolase n=1 Tax=Streptomyces sp. MBT62 TaxID=2800410 RepID=UPI00190A8A28|nr:MBL fold metallo-hydrolase [Streptomyces sp. MBT62]MBK3562870.1 MBL fold metallo-hydrolase [Streptomyces sp. MBT62]
MSTGSRPIDFTSGALEERPLDLRWIHGSPSAKHNTDPDIQVHAYNEHSYILRQNKAVHYEAPFLFLLFGNERVMLVDTGATESPEWFPLRRTIDGLIDDWLSRNPRQDYTLLVLHSHAHGDHIAGDAQFADRPQTVVVPADRAGSWPFFGFDRDPEGVARIDLGGRIVDCLATPGHHETAVTYHDPHTGWLLTGDTLYPGRLYVNDWPAFTRTAERLVDFAAARRVTHVLGCHIEMTRTPGVDYPVRTTYQPDEAPLPLTTDHLRELRQATRELNDQPGRHAYRDFIVCHDA